MRRRGILHGACTSHTHTHRARRLRAEGRELAEIDAAAARTLPQRCPRPGDGSLGGSPWGARRRGIRSWLATDNGHCAAKDSAQCFLYISTISLREVSYSTKSTMHERYYNRYRGAPMRQPFETFVIICKAPCASLF